MHINSIRTVIKAFTPNGIEDFGFSFEFEEGLNILTGDNSSGKSTVLSCINYCLGLEQLIGSKGVNALSPALYQALSADGHSYNIVESECFLVFTGSNGKQYTLNRKIKLGDDTKFNEIIIDAEGETFSRFIHSERDHAEQGFFKWLAEVNNLDIFEVESFKEGATKPLYLQNIFTLSFIEQTKGWSDIFSMMPTFGIKDPKQKVVEYCLGLHSLHTNMELDVIKSEKDIVKRRWKSILDDLDYRAQSSQLYVSHISKKSPASEKNINALYLAEISEDSKEVKFSKVIENLNESIEFSKNKIKKNEVSNIKSKELIAKKDDIQTSLKKYLDEREEISSLYEEEKYKLSSYQEVLSDIDSDIQDFKDVKKISIDRNWSKISSAKCPVCDSNVTNKKDENLSEEKIGKTVAFLRSQQSTYQSYIKASDKVIERYISALSYYDKKIQLKREQLDSLFNDLESPNFNSSSTDFEILAELKHRRCDLGNFQNFFEMAKKNLLDQSTQYFYLKGEEDRLKSLVSSDDEKVLSFRKGFKSLLDFFGYRSNGVDNITIKDDSLNRLLPSVFIKGQEPQYIRYVSSASDFVRSIWAYYIALLVEGDRHPGFLVMDEPGQHQMRLDSMKSLLSVCSQLNKQIILAISQDREYDRKEVNINTLVEGIEGYKLLHIDDGFGCIARIKDEPEDIDDDSIELEE